ncbi:hypothetical protein KH5H1_20930 [Corallococcus caeni]|uniref:Uncharacterized protein n=1 Tax=Corallococcus caeni TaxID=3082388 RepID=A0ABQ6QT76_9BACT|nr:hypothetical protein KH5H1_20930 [Corallococcus sp. KH5-1]GMU07220.1 hypothetical protein ASNO1_34730 [Corallococcus sp. NO1]
MRFLAMVSPPNTAPEGAQIAGTSVAQATGKGPPCALWSDLASGEPTQNSCEISVTNAEGACLDTPGSGS